MRSICRSWLKATPSQGGSLCSGSTSLRSPGHLDDADKAIDRYQSSEGDEDEVDDDDDESEEYEDEGEEGADAEEDEKPVAGEYHV